MRAILIDPFARQITEIRLPLVGDFMGNLAEIIVTNALATDVAPPHTAMFLDAIGHLRERRACWRHADQPIDRNVSGRAVIFGLAPDGKLADLPADVTIASLAARIIWTDDEIERFVEKMVLVNTDAGPAPFVHRTVVWRPGAVHPASETAATPVAVAQGVDDASPYVEAPAAAPTPPAASPAPPPRIVPLWAIHETADGRYRVIEYEVTDAGLGQPLSLRTVPNLDAARAIIPAGMQKRDADEETDDDTLVEAWF